MVSSVRALNKNKSGDQRHGLVMKCVVRILGDIGKAEWSTSVVIMWRAAKVKCYVVYMGALLSPRGP